MVTSIVVDIGVCGGVMGIRDLLALTIDDDSSASLVCWEAVTCGAKI